MTDAQSPRRWMPPPGAEQEEPVATANNEAATAAVAPPPRLCFPNTLAGGAKVPFVPLKPGRVTWYACGPTVYDSAHMGHARAYVSFDVVRRVLEDWFGLDVHLVMNVTDVDDKIIARARRGEVLKNYLCGCDSSPSSSRPSAAQVLADAREAVSAALEKQEERLARAQEAAKAEAEKASSNGGISRSPSSSAEAGTGGATATAADLSARRQNKELAESVGVEELKAQQLRDASKKLSEVQIGRKDDGDKNAVAAVVSAAGDVLADHLDVVRGLGASITDPRVFREHAARYEAEFLKDMSDLRVRPPSVLTRVSEYMEEIVSYVSRIVDSGFGYTVSVAPSRSAESSDSARPLGDSSDVYFDVAAFRAAGFSYGKLRPWSAAASAGEEESAAPPPPRQSSSNGTASPAPSRPNGKRSAADFALWKAAKPGEPSWTSPWGLGRPGWHIECSAMACSVLGGAIDVHSGGEDLAFPHHDNEIAQADAFYSVSSSCCGGGGGGGGEWSERRGGCVGGCCGSAPTPSSPTRGYHHQQWVNYWLHAGHLSIDGLKMSKSLKNFVTIREALSGGATPAQLRILFASTRWDRPMTYSPAAIEEARKKEGAFKRLFATVSAAKRREESSNKKVGLKGSKNDECDDENSWRRRQHEPSRWDERDVSFEAAVETCRDTAHAAFCDGVDSPAALEAVLALCRDAQRYVASCEQKAAVDSAPPPSSLLPPRQPRALLLHRAATVATRVLSALGISTCGSGSDDVGLGGEREVSRGAAAAVDAVVALRSSARGAAKAAGAASAKAKGDRACSSSDAAAEFAAALRAAAAEAEAEARQVLGVELLPAGKWAPLSSNDERGDEENDDEGSSLPASDDPTAVPFLDALSQMLSAVKEAASEAAKASDGGGRTPLSSSALMSAADACRDGALAFAGIRLEDDADGVGSFWSADDPAALRAEASARDAAAASVKARKAAAAAAAAARDVDKLEKAEQCPTPQEALRDKYSRFDESGNPTHAADGTELDERAKSKASKEAEKKRKGRQPFEEAIKNDPDALSKARAKVVDLKEAAAEAAELARAAEEAAKEAASSAKKEKRGRK